MGMRILIGLTLLLFTSGCQQKEDTITPTVGAITESVYANGLVKAEGQYQVFPTVNGTVLSLLVKEGDTVKKNDPLLVLEAMKMENVIKSAGDAVVKKIHAVERTAVEKGQILLSFE